MLVVLQKNSLCFFYFLLIPNGPAGLLVSVNEEPVQAIGILLLSSRHLQRDGVAVTPTVHASA